MKLQENPFIQKNVVPPSSGLKSKQNKKPAETGSKLSVLVTVPLLSHCDVDKLQVSMHVVLVMQSSSPMYQGGRYSVTLLFVNVLILTYSC
jgi:hypothetical protein